MKTQKELLVEAVAELTYKPNWTFAVEEFQGLDGQMILTLNIKCDAVCVETGSPITIDRHFVAPRAPSPNRALAHFLDSAMPGEFKARYWIADCIEEIENHEIQEFLKFAGKRWYDDVHGKDGY